MASAPGCHLQVASAPAVAFNRLQHRLSPTTGFTIGCLLQWRQHRLSPSCGFRPQLSPANRLQHGCRLQHAPPSAATYNTGSNPRLSPLKRLQYRLTPLYGDSIGCRLQMASAPGSRHQIGFDISCRLQQASASAVALKSASALAVAFNRIQPPAIAVKRLQHRLTPSTGFSIGCRLQMASAPDCRRHIGFSIGCRLQQAARSVVAFE